MEIIKLDKSKPLCPNHGCPLEGIPWPQPKKGEGMCPVSGAHFAYEAEGDDMKNQVTRDKFGNTIKSAVWKVTGDETS